MKLPRPLGWLLVAVGLVVVLAASVGILGDSEDPVPGTVAVLVLVLLVGTVLGRNRGLFRQSAAEGPNAERIGASSSTGRRLQRFAGAALVAIALFLMLVVSTSGEEESSTAEPLLVLALLLVLGLVLNRTAGQTSRSLRRQLAVLGITAVLLPMLLLLVTFAAGGSDSEINIEDGEGALFSETTDGLGADVVLVALLLSVGSGIALWAWSMRAVKPMAAITDVANEIQAGSLDRRIGLEGAASEVQALADSFDQMLDRLSTASQSQKQLIEDASHELRTPLAALAVNNEVMLRNTDPTMDEYRASAERSEALIGRLQTTLDELLVDARSRTQRAGQVDNDLMAIVHRVALQHRILKPTIPVAVRGPAELRLGIDGPSVERALTNLVENAARYSPVGVPISIDVAELDEGGATLSVTDHGPGIPANELDTVFDRYYQGEESGDTTDGSTEAGTAGIGLALVKQVAEAHGGVEVVSPLPGDTVGTRFTLTF